MARKIDLEALCNQKGLRITEQRRIIARVLSEAEDHPDVERVYERASSIDPGISIATVYRTVRLFEEAGILDRHDFGDGRARYEPAREAPFRHERAEDVGGDVEKQERAVAGADARPAQPCHGPERRVGGAVHEAAEFGQLRDGEVNEERVQRADQRLRGVETPGLFLEHVWPGGGQVRLSRKKTAQARGVQKRRHGGPSSASCPATKDRIGARLMTWPVSQ